MPEQPHGSGHKGTMAVQDAGSRTQDSQSSALVVGSEATLLGGESLNSRPNDYCAFDQHLLPGTLSASLSATQELGSSGGGLASLSKPQAGNEPVGKKELSIHNLDPNGMFSLLGYAIFELLIDHTWRQTN